MAEPGADFERHELLGRTLPELYVRVGPFIHLQAYSVCNYMTQATPRGFSC